MTADRIALQNLGQSGFRFALGERVVYVDPYLSDRVAELYGEDLRRLRPAPLPPTQVRDADWVLITHAHEDHCDPDTLVPLARSSPQARFMGPPEALALLAEQGIAGERLEPAATSWRQLDSETAVRAIPAAHPELERDARGGFRAVGYLIRHRGRRIYHAGDTSPHREIFAALADEKPIDVAFLPVNERNYYREERGIVGNMSVREAFQMAADLGVDTLVPIHWDLFAPNGVPREELELLHELLSPPFRMLLHPSSI